MSDTCVDILIADDHPIVRIGVRKMLESVPGLNVVGEASNGAEALKKVEELHPEITLLDLEMPLMSGIETLRELEARQSSTKVIILSAILDKKKVLDALQLGARGIVQKSAAPTEICSCISTIMESRFWIIGKAVDNLSAVLEKLIEETSTPPNKKTFGLTPRELQITTFIADGHTNRDIAQETNISEETVKHHLKRIFDKTGVSTRLELAIFAMNHGLSRPT